MKRHCPGMKDLLSVSHQACLSAGLLLVICLCMAPLLPGSGAGEAYAGAGTEAAALIRLCSFLLRPYVLLPVCLLLQGGLYLARKYGRLRTTLGAAAVLTLAAGLLLWHSGPETQPPAQNAEMQTQVPAAQEQALPDSQDADTVRQTQSVQTQDADPVQQAQGQQDADTFRQTQSVQSQDPQDAGPVQQSRPAQPRSVQSQDPQDTEPVQQSQSVQTQDPRSSASPMPPESMQTESVQSQSVQAARPSRFLFLCLLCFSLFFTVSVICLKASQSFPLRAALTLLLLSVMVFCSIRRLSVPKWGVCLMLACLLLLLTEAAQCFRRRGRGGNDAASASAPYSLYLLPFCLLVSFSLMTVPAGDTPLQWTFVKQTVQSAKEQLQACMAGLRSHFDGASELYSLSFTGYSPGQPLGGSLAGQDGREREQLKLVCAGTRSPLYLIGSVYDTYTGSRWTQSETALPYSGREYLLQYRQFSQALSRSTLSQEEKQAATRPFVLLVKFSDIRTKSLFYAPLTRTLMLPDNASLDKKAGSRLLLKSAKSAGYDYTINCMEYNGRDERLRSLFRGEAWNAETDPDPALAAREAFIREQYTALPDGLPLRVRQLALSLTEAADNDYDKLCAIESYLHRFPYTTTPGAPPGGQDFTDYFLFEGQTGYCTYYATAMAVLGRCAGIPTRYAEGFFTDATSKKGAREVSLSGGSAHAWAEGYLEGIGWIPFEPTPGYDRDLSGWESTAVPGQQEPSQKKQSSLSGNSLLPEDAAPAGNGQTARTFPQTLLFAAVLACCFCLAAAAALAVRHALRLRRYRRLKAPEKTVLLMKNALTLAKLQGLFLSEGETLSAFASRAETLLDTPQLSFYDLCSLYQEARFGDAGASPELVQRMETYCAALRRKCLARCGRIRRLLFRLR